MHKYNNLKACAALVLAVFLCIGLLGSCSEDKQPLLGVEKPQWDKFVTFTTDEVKIHKAPSDDSPVLVSDFEDCECDMPDYSYGWSDTPERKGYSRSETTLGSGQVCPLLADEGEWLKVYVGTEEIWEAFEGYVKKSQCSEVTPQPITSDVLSALQDKCYTCFGLVAEGPLAGLCPVCKYGEMDEVYFALAELVDGCLLQPEPKKIVSVQYPQADEMPIQIVSEDDGWQIAYGKNHCYRLSTETEPTTLLNTRQLSAEQVDSLYQFMHNDSPRFMTVGYYVPTVSSEHLFTFYVPLEASAASDEQAEAPAEQEEEKAVTGYKVVGKEMNYRLMAEQGGEWIETGITSDMFSMYISDQRDYDEDGHVEALVFESNGGNAADPLPYVVYYDKESATFGQTSEIELADPEIEKWNGKWSFVMKYGVHTDRWVYENHSVRQVENKTESVGKADKVIKRSDYFAEDDEEDGTQWVSYDLDDDGVADRLCFYHCFCKWLLWGAQMQLQKIEWGKGGETETSCCGEEFKFLQHKTNGVRDILVGDYLYRWDGTEYKE